VVSEMKVTINKDKCIGAGQCVMTVPEVFDQDEEEGTVVLLQETPPQAVAEDVRKAVSFCPAGVIAIDE
jgi:ferredoxin